jgi:hypothetical protein
MYRAAGARLFCVYFGYGGGRKLGLVDRLWFVLFAPVVLGVSVALYRWRRGMAENDRRILFEEQSITVVEVLNLNS